MAILTAPIDNAPDSIVILLSLLLVGSFVWSIVAAVKHTATKIKYRGDYLSGGKVKHTSGLNLPDGTICKLICLKSKMIFSANGQEIILPGEKLVSVEIMSKTEIKKQYVSNPSGALAGALVGGVLGAVVFGTPTKKELRIPRKNLVVTYLKNGDPAFILFDATYNDIYATRIVRDYKYLRKNAAYKTEL